MSHHLKYNMLHGNTTINGYSFVNAGPYCGLETVCTVQTADFSGLNGSMLYPGYPLSTIFHGYSQLKEKYHQTAAPLLVGNVLAATREPDRCALSPY